MGNGRNILFRNLPFYKGVAMKVWVVNFVVDYEGATVTAVFSNEKKAKAYVEEGNKEDHYHDTYYEYFEMEVE